MARSDGLIDQPLESGRGRSVGQETGDVANEVSIPWRTSRRLQEATLKSLQERDSALKSNMSVVKKCKETPSPVSKKETSSPQPVSTRSLRRQHSSSETLTAAEQKDTCERKDSAGRKKAKNVQFSDPVFTHIEEQKPSPSASNTTSTTCAAITTTNAANKLASTKKSATRHIIPAKQPRNVALQQHLKRKYPISCFDLFCNHIGTKGWRCYRTCMQGEAFCSNHLNRATTSVARISVCT
ncbi:hypothetical protein Mapa_007180 [Marchantia paleacea]|nr:hypothetical protein Mapa_007180 [Marchantia paleacea]